MKVYNIYFKAYKGTTDTTDKGYKQVVIAENRKLAEAKFNNSKYEQRKAGWNFEIYKVENARELGITRNILY